jgi:hypothetical protein
MKQMKDKKERELGYEEKDEKEIEREDEEEEME